MKRKLAEQLKRSSIEFSVITFEQFALEVYHDDDDEWCMRAVARGFYDEWHGYDTPHEARQAFGEFLGRWRDDEARDNEEQTRRNEACRDDEGT